MSLEFIKPQLATSVDHPPPRAGWIHEVKHDGYRTLLIIERHKARAYTRNGFDWSESYLVITKAAAKLDCRSAIIDGEVIVQDKHGVSDFEAIKSAIRWYPQRLIFCAFDLLHFERQGLSRPAIGGAKGQAKRTCSERTPVLVQRRVRWRRSRILQSLR
jgi:bifunctional non-homologous end joining protein LigD